MWHLWQQKKLNRCWKARAQHARVRLREQNFSFSTLSAPRPPSMCGNSFLTTPRTLPQTIHRNACSSCKKNQHTDTSQHFFTVQSLVFNPNRSLDPKQISLDCWADGWLWVQRRSGLRRERTSNKMPTRKWKMAGSYILGNKLHNNGLMTDWCLSFIDAYIHRRCHHKVQRSFPSFLFHHLNIHLN